MREESERLDHDYAIMTQHLLRLAPQAGLYESCIPGVSYSRRERSEHRESVLYPPCIGVVVQGQKRAVIGLDENCYGRGEFLLCCVDMPSSFQITGTPEEPFLTVSLRLDPVLLSEIFSEMDAVQCEKSVGEYAADAEAVALPQTYHSGPERGVRVGSIKSDLLNAFQRLVSLADQPRKARFVAPLIVKEIHYYLASGPDGRFLRSFFAPSSQSGQIARAISYMREHCSERLRIEGLARMANMAESTFNRNFKKVTSLSPLQYHKHLKLYEAKRLMVQQGMSAAAACFAVGYESQQQFTREYKRLFGCPPMRDTRRRPR